jgi:hypothetical protein
MTLDAFAFYFRSFLIYCALPPVAVMLYICLPKVMGGIGAGWLTSLGLVAVAFYLMKKCGTHEGGGWFHIAVILAVTLGLQVGFLRDEYAVLITTGVYLFGQFTAALSLIVAILLLSLWTSGTPDVRLRSRDRRTAIAALLYFPFFVLSGVGALLWVVGLSLVKAVASDQLRGWEHLYNSANRSFGHNLAFVEYAFTGFNLGIALLLGVVGAFWMWGEGGKTEQFVQNWVQRVLHPLSMLGVLVCVITLLCISGFANGNETTLDIYSTSASRIAPYLLLAFGSLRIIPNMINDVVLYLAAERISTAKKVRERLEKALRYVILPNKNIDIVVAAHSQGSVVAADVLAKFPWPMGEGKLRFVTFGSPLTSLHERFLASTVTSRTNVAEPPLYGRDCWINFFRIRDFIGGRQLLPDADVQEELLNDGGHHTDYWSSNQMWSRVVGWALG